jgi:hypothetical protein
MLDKYGINQECSITNCATYLTTVLCYDRQKFIPRFESVQSKGHMSWAPLNILHDLGNDDPAIIFRHNYFNTYNLKCNRRHRSIALGEQQIDHKYVFYESVYMREREYPPRRATHFRVRS